jgi:hypothetical protein
MSIVSFIMMPVAFVAAARWQGASGVAAAWVALFPLTMLPLLIVLLRHIELPFRHYIEAVLPAMAGTAAMGVAVFALRGWLAASPWPAQLRLAALVGVGAAVYGGILMGFFRERILRYVNFLSGLRKGKEMPIPAIL